MKTDNLRTGKSAGAGIARLLTEQRDRGPGTIAHDVEHNIGGAGPVAKIIRTKQPLLFPKRKTKADVKPLPLPPGGVQEFRFHHSRKWRFDWAWPAAMVALEIEGGTFCAGRHSRGAGMRADMEKYNEAALLGWLVLRVLPEWVKNGKAGALVSRALLGRSV